MEIHESTSPQVAVVERPDRKPDPDDSSDDTSNARPITFHQNVAGE
jgi:hypothetical protein